MHIDKDLVAASATPLVLGRGGRRRPVPPSPTPVFALWTATFVVLATGSRRRSRSVAVTLGANVRIATSSHPLEPWGRWILRWYAAMTVTSYLALAGYLAVDSGEPQSLPLLVVWLPLIALLTGLMTLVASGLRWMLSRFATVRMRDAIVPVVGLGAVSGSLALFVLFASGDLRSLVEPARTGLDVIFAAPLVLGGGVASYLAERQVSVRRPGWWVAVVAAAAVGLVLLRHA
jgi:hypothetical protein